ncbi:MAG: CDP-glycerol glycerophosphotransferase family protein [Bacteroidaceae bacterium]|nr:CDP-glycerol glycerophosphotransferase family protein [Bacteroidaceae bacterium]
MLNKLQEKIKQFVGINFVDSLYKALTFRDFFIAAFPSCLLRKVRKVRRIQDRKIKALRQQDKCCVLFFLQTPSVWKYDSLYRKLESSEYFEPLIVVSPYNVHLNYDMQECFRVMHQTEDFARESGYQYISAYNWEKCEWRDIKKLCSPDVVFFTKPYKDTLPAYHIYHYTDVLTLYVPYGINCMHLYHNNYELPFQSLLWKFLLETDFQKHYAEIYEKSHGDNVEVVGALAMEKLMQKEYETKDVWKPQEVKKKRIIWAPHHTVDYLFNFSNFLNYCDDMLRLAEKYKEEVQFAFKPHPVLKFKLINIWGKEKTDAYYNRWEQLDNGQIKQGDYIDLFKTSDAMVHDSASFTVEYLYAKKPVLFQIRDEKVKDEFNSFGQLCFEKHYHAYSIEETEAFIRDVVIADNDPKKEDREQFYKNYLYPKDGVMPSDKIISLLQTAIGK